MLRVAEFSAKSDTGRQRSANEDALLARAPLFAVADGMGGAQAGEVASGIAIRTFAAGLPDATPPERALAERALEANREIHELAGADLKRAGMGTTLSAVHVGERDVAIAHVGDSRVYVLRDGALTRLTRDHSLVEELVRRGQLTEAEAGEHPQRSIITRALGPEPSVEIDTRSYAAQAGDVFLLCSDGLTGMITEDEVRDLIAGAGRLDDAARQLIDAANAAGGRDNITVVLIRLEEVGGVAPAVAPEQPTLVGVEVPAAQALRADTTRVAAEPPPGRPVPAEADEPRPQSRALPPSAPRPPRPRRRRGVVLALTSLTLLAALLAGGWVASRAVYFVGTDADGQVAIFRGLPYELPAGIRLYERWYVSGVPAAIVPAPRRAKLLDHQLRSERDARDLVRRLETGKLSS